MSADIISTVLDKLLMQGSPAVVGLLTGGFIVKKYFTPKGNSNGMTRAECERVHEELNTNLQTDFANGDKRMSLIEKDQKEALKYLIEIKTLLGVKKKKN